MGDVIELFGSPVRSGGWTEQEKAELYRAASLLGARGLPFDSEFGTTDDGDPWFLFIGRGTDAAIRLDDDYVSTRHARIASSADQWFVLPTSMNSMNRTACPRARK